MEAETKPPRVQMISVSQKDKPAAAPVKGANMNFQMLKKARLM